MGLTASSDAPPAPAASTAGDLAFTAWCVTAAFGAYFCMYGFRKPFTAAGYEGQTAWGRDYKTVLVVAQVLGYTLSKFIGIPVVAGMRPERRAAGILVLIGTAHLALLLFAVTPFPLNVACLFLNGVPLGMVFGLVIGFLEGRKLTEALTACLWPASSWPTAWSSPSGRRSCNGASASRGCRSRPVWCSCRRWGCAYGCSAGFRLPRRKTWRCGANGRR